MKSISDIVTTWYYLAVNRTLGRKRRRLIEKIRGRGYANVVFIAPNPTMWRYQGIYDLMKQDPRFHVTILLTTFKDYSDAQNTQNIKALREYFDSKGVAYHDTTTWTPDKYNIRDWLDPDIMFYPQPYSRCFGNPLDNRYFKDKLVCFAPYGFGTVSQPWALNASFQNIAWKLFYETDVYRDAARKLAYNHGVNVEVVGNTNADEFLKPEHNDPWKDNSHSMKKVIWAPHFTLTQGLKFNRSGFVWLHEIMLKLAHEYNDRIQFAFKPHPRLKSVLYELPDWGKERTDSYYQEWSRMPNTQLEESAFIDLFMNSDAMIHDCASFTVEYHYTRKPCLFTTHNIQEIREPLNELGRAALDAHYQGNDEDDIRQFLEQTVLAGNDPKQGEREEFFRKYLLPPKGNTTAGNIYESIVQSIWN